MREPTIPHPVPSPRGARRARHVALWALSCALVCMAHSAMAWAQSRDGQIAQHDAEQASQNTRAISLRLAREKGLDASYRVMLANLQKRLGQISARQAWRPYVPIASIAVDWRDDASLVVLDGRDRSFVYGAELDWLLPSGTLIQASLGATDYLAGASFLPTPATGFGLDVVQPLLRNGWGEGNVLEQQDLEIDLQRALFEQELNDFLGEVEIAYWNLAYAQAYLEISQRSVERAKKQFEDTRANIDRGLLAPGEIYIVEENLVFFEQQLVRAIEDLSLARIELARLMLARGEVAWRADVDLGQSLPDRSVPPIERAIEVALEQNPQLRAQRVVLEQADWQVRFDTNQIMPQLDVRAGTNLAGTDVDRFGAWGEVWRVRNPSWNIGLLFSMPIVRDPDYARVERAEVQRDRAKLQIKQSEADLGYDVRSLVTQVERRVQVLELAERGVTLAELKLQTETEKYQSGLSTLANVVLFQRDWDRARIARMRAITDVHIARTRLSRQLGTLYQRAGVVLR